MIVADLAPVEARMRAAVTRAGPAEGLYASLRYHLGWADASGNDAEHRSAKGLRPRVCLLACQAVGGGPAAAQAAAAAVELTHEFSLIHDDVEDRDMLRRGRPTLWAHVGVSQAINAGDALFAIARAELRQAAVTTDVAMAMASRYDTATLHLAEGQFLDLALESSDSATISDYEAMVEGKTGALLGLAAALGALCGGRTSAVDSFDAYGRALGVGFQIADDILGLWGDPTQTGKPAGADLVSGKKGYPTVLALADRKLAPVVLRARGGEPEAVADALDALKAADIRSRSAAAARSKAEEALLHLNRLELADAPREALERLAHQAVDRDR